MGSRGHAKFRRICRLSSMQQLQKHTHAAKHVCCVCKDQSLSQSAGIPPFFFVLTATFLQTDPNATVLLRGNMHLSSTAFYSTVMWVKVSSLGSFIYFEWCPNVAPGTAAAGLGPVQLWDAGEGGTKTGAWLLPPGPAEEHRLQPRLLSAWNQYRLTRLIVRP